MRGDEHRFAHRADLRQNLLHLRPGARVHARGRFVENQQFWVVEQRPRQAQALLHAARQPVHIGLALVRQCGQSEQPVNPAPPVLRADAHAARIQIEVLPRLQVVVHAEEIRHIAHELARPLRILYHADAVYERIAGRGAHQRRENPHGRRLACAVRADKGVQLARADVQVDAVKRQHPSVSPGQLIALDHGHSPPSSPPR